MSEPVTELNFIEQVGNFIGMDLATIGVIIGAILGGFASYLVGLYFHKKSQQDMKQENKELTILLDSLTDDDLEVVEKYKI